MEDNSEEITNQVILVNNRFYTKKTCNVSGSLRFPIPIEIKTELDLKSGDICYFVEYEAGYYIVFNEIPEGALKKKTRSRKLAKAGMYETLFVCIPHFIKNTFENKITHIQLIHPSGFKRNEWQIRFFTDSI